MKEFIKKYKYSCTSKWSIYGAEKEIIRAGKFLIAQINKGWTPEEACEQVEQSYGYLISNACFKYFNKSLKKYV